MAGAHERARGVAAAVLSAAIALGLVTAAAQTPQSSPPQPPPQPPSSSADVQRPPTIRTGAELVRVDVTVIDHKGRPVPELTADDFEVREDDVPQTIQSFKFVAVNGHPEEGDELSLPIRSREHAAAEAARDDVRVFLIFWDEYHINRMSSALYAREGLMKFVRSAFGPKDLVAFMDPLTPTDALRFTRDRHELSEKVRTLQGRLGVYTPARSVLEEAHMYSREGVERVRSQVTLTALKSAAAYLGSLRQGRKAIVFISEGMVGLGRDEPMMISDLIRVANDSNTGIFTLNPQGLTLGRSMRFDMLRALASNTGGEAYVTNDLEVALRRVVTQSSAYYLLGYAPSRRALDGKFHRIRVRVKRPDLEVRARAGYWAPTVADMERAGREAADTLPPAIASALGELAPATARRSADVWVGTAAGAAGRPQVRVVWSPREPEPGEPPQDVTGAALTATGAGGAVYKGEVTRDGVSFEAPAGPLQLVLDFHNAAGETLDRHARSITVPDAAAANLWISSPVVLRASTALELRHARRERETVPEAAREFERSDRLLIRCTVNGERAAQAEVSARLLNGRGAFLTNLPVGRAADGNEYELDLLLQSIARGDFLVAIQARQGSEQAETFVPIRILR